MNTPFPPCTQIVTVSSSSYDFDNLVNELLVKGYAIHSITVTDGGNFVAVLYRPKSAPW